MARNSWSWERALVGVMLLFAMTSVYGGVHGFIRYAKVPMVRGACVTDTWGGCE